MGPGGMAAPFECEQSRWEFAAIGVSSSSCPLPLGCAWRQLVRAGVRGWRVEGSRCELLIGISSFQSGMGI